MSKKSKSKNSIVKKAKKFQRQGKFEKAIKLCDDYLDNEKLEESIIQIKVDNLSDLFYQKNLSEKFTRYTNELDYFLDAEEEKEFLKIVDYAMIYVMLLSLGFNAMFVMEKVKVEIWVYYPLIAMLAEVSDM